MIVGAAESREAVRGVFSDGPAVHFGPEAQRFGMDKPLPDDQQAAREQLQFEAHCEAMPLDLMGGMVDLQRYRDAKFAAAALRALEAFGPPVAVIAGNGHARTDWGVPAAIRLAAPDVSVHAVGFVEGSAHAPFDEVHIVPPVDRGAPCEAFK